MEIKAALEHVVGGQDLSQQDMASVMSKIMSGQASPAQIGALLVALRIKGETVDEITGAAQVMRELALSVPIEGYALIDTCGTGGDGSHLFNVSTASAFVVAAAGGYVAKHGNRSVTSSTGSADVLEAAGVKLDLKPEQVARCVTEVGLGFMFAPAHHGAMKHAIGPRKELGLRTIFNVLGPLTNPAGATRQVLGVYSKTWCRPLAEVLGRLGSEHVLVVHSDDGLDEFSPVASSSVAELRNGQISEYTVTPQALGCSVEDLEGLQVTSAQQSLALIKGAFSNSAEPAARKAANMIALNAGAALYVGGMAQDLSAGVAMAEDVIAAGAALEKIKQLAEFSSCMN